MIYKTDLIITLWAADTTTATRLNTHHKSTQLRLRHLNMDTKDIDEVEATRSVGKFEIDSIFGREEGPGVHISNSDLGGQVVG